MKFCLAHHRFEIWIQDLCYAWITGEADERDRQAFYGHFINQVFNETRAVGPINPQPEGCRFEEKLIDA